MDVMESERRVIEAALELARTLGTDDNHTVAAAAMDTHGRIHTGVNVYHFNGGPCAELVTLGVAAAAGAGPLVTMVAAGDGERGVVPPCGRCRQVMLDLHPDLLIAVPGGDGPRMQPITKLLPHTFFHPDARPTRVLRFDRRYYEGVVSGQKTSTVRWDEYISEGPVTLYFEDSGHAPLSGRITAIQKYRLDDLTPERLRLVDGATVGQYRESLRGHYPLMPDDSVVDVVDFTVVTP